MRRWRTSVLRIGVAVTAVGLMGSYVGFRDAQARQQREAATKAAAPASNPADTGEHVSGNGTIGAGFKLNNSVSAEFAVGSDVKAGIINLMPNDSSSATTQPAAAPPPSK